MRIGPANKYYYEEVVRPIQNCDFIFGEPEMDFDPIEMDDKIEATLEGSLNFIDGTYLKVYEKIQIIEGEVGKPKFKYNYFNAQKELIIGWHCKRENRYKNLKSYPRHKHVRSEIKECAIPTMEDVLSEISPYIKDSIY